MSIPDGSCLRRFFTCLAVTALPFLSLTSGVSAQAPTAADSAAVLLQTARDFQDSGRGEVAEALYAYILQQFGGTPAADDARIALEQWRAANADGSGRVELQVWGTLYGVWLGVAVPTALDADDAEAYGVGILLGAPAGFLAARAVTRSRSLGEGQTRVITWGGTWGTYQGLGWSQVLDLGEETICTPDFCYDADGDRTQEIFGSMVVGGLVGVVVGGVLSRRDIDPGVATGAHYGSVLGTWVGLAGGMMAGLGDADEDDLWLSTLLAGNAGLAGGAWVAHRYGWSRNRVRLVGLGSLLGGLAGVGIDLIAQPDDDEVAFGIPLASSLGGLAVAIHMTRDYDAGPGSGSRVDDMGALLSFQGESGWSMNVPMPLPTLLRVPDVNGRDMLRPGLRFTLLSGRF